MKLSVKELADQLGRSPWFVYKMRCAGFAMEWNAATKCYEATLADAQAWIELNKFCVVRGKTAKAKEGATTLQAH